MQDKPIRIGTRGSPLARAQAVEVRTCLIKAHPLSDSDFEIVIIKTSGDAIVDQPLSDLGGKGLFTKEIEDALFSGDIDLAVHSMKDVPTVLPDGLTMAAILPREDVRDAFLSLQFQDLAALPPGARVGTSSLRRRAQLKRIRPDLHVVDFRGNVGTRLEKLQNGKVDATFLACAGLNRLGMADKVTSVIATNIMLPAVAQGAIGIEIRDNDAVTRDLVSALNDAETERCVAAERAFLKVLDGSCRTPIAGLATCADGIMTFRGETLSPDGQKSLLAENSGAECDGIKIAKGVAHDLLERGARALMS